MHVVRYCTLTAGNTLVLVYWMSYLFNRHSNFTKNSPKAAPCYIYSSGCLRGRTLKEKVPFRDSKRRSSTLHWSRTLPVTLSTKNECANNVLSNIGAGQKIWLRYLFDIIEKFLQDSLCSYCREKVIFKKNSFIKHVVYCTRKHCLFRLRHGNTSMKGDVNSNSVEIFFHLWKWNSISQVVGWHKIGKFDANKLSGVEWKIFRVKITETIRGANIRSQTWYWVQLKQCQQHLSPSTYFFAWPTSQGREHTLSGGRGCPSLNWISARNMRVGSESTGAVQFHEKKKQDCKTTNLLLTGHIQI